MQVGVGGPRVTEALLEVDAGTATEMGGELRLAWRALQQAQARFTHKLATPVAAQALARSKLLM